MSHSVPLVLFAVAPLVWNGGACDPSHAPTVDGPDPTVITDIDPSCGYSDDGGADVESVSLNGRWLAVVVGYEGGCSVHTFASCWDGGWSVGSPPTVDVEILHDDGGESCEGYVRDTLHFDVTFVRDETIAEMGPIAGVWLDVEGQRAWLAF